MIPKRVVLDTNVCLDLFVFHDPRYGPLQTALESGDLSAVTRVDCRNEWLYVLGYPHLPLSELSRSIAVAAFDRLIRLLDDTPASPPESAAAHRLPMCKDRDDQKFLELARDAGAELLLTKDKALLKLARKTRRDGLFDIMTPGAWVDAQSSAKAVPVAAAVTALHAASPVTSSATSPAT